MIKDILLTQKRELEEKFKEKYIERIFDEKRLKNDLIKVIIGPRRAGKSFLGINILKKNGKYGYVNFDDERLIDIKDYDEIINNLDIIYNTPQLILFDEIQNINRWEFFVNRLHRSGRNIIITGSNSKLLNKEFASHLTGRHIAITVFPFLFPEYLKLAERELTTSEIKSKLNEYLEKGGFPEPLIKNIDLKDYLSILFDSILYKDIVKRYKIRFPAGIEDLATYLLSNITKEYSYHTLTKVTKCKNVKTIEKYLSYLEESFILFKVNRFSFKLKEQISFNKKIYSID
ncbi:MAG: ATP-binding protein, partial [Chitinispirillaceae bacterium]|nr:ATP-binding protein [Chitinispirillaceae bacterium]